MKISDSERREVAARLRELSSDTYAAIKEWAMEGLFIDASIGDEADYSQIHNAVFGCFPAEHMHPGDYEELHDRLADLIDRPTCRMSDIGDDTEQVYRCSACGEEYCMSDVKPYPWRFCPNCGSTVTESGGCDVPEL